MFGFGRRQQDRIEPRLDSPRVRNDLNNPDTLGTLTDQGIVDLFRGFEAGTFGPPINEISAMRISTVFACVSLAAGLVSSAPLGVYRDSPETGRVLATDVRLHRLLSVSPYPGRALTSATWRQMWLTHVWLWGNHFTKIVYDGAGRVFGFEPILPWLVRVSQTPAKQNVYTVEYENGTREVLAQDEVLHFSGMSFNGLTGVSRIQQFARDPIALAKVLEEQTGRVHENSSRPSGMVTLPPTITPDGKRRIEAFWNERFTGRHNAGKVVFADKDSVFTPFQMSAEDLNTLATRQFQAAEICRFFGTPPHLIGEAANTSAWGSGIEQLTLGYKQFTLHPQLVDFEQELLLKLFPPNSALFPMFDRDSLVVMDAVTKANTTQTRIQSGLLTLNDGRRAMNMPAYKVPGADEPLVNATMIPLSRAMNPPAPPPQFAPKPDDPPGKSDDPPDKSDDPPDKSDDQPAKPKESKNAP